MKKKKTIKKGRHSRVFLSGISLLYVVHQMRKQLPCFIRAKKSGDPRTLRAAQLGMTASFGFTLIELLVVVLIIGILAAVALPQYQKAVERSRAAEAEIMLRTLRDAQARCILEKGNIQGCQQGNEDEDHLFVSIDIDMGTLIDDDEYACESCAMKGKYFVYVMDGPDITAKRMQNGENLYRLWTSADESGELNRIVCGSGTSYCKALGYTEDVWNGKVWAKP